MARDYYNRNRNAWDRSRDEVRSWFGDEEAERRRSLDSAYDDWNDDGPQELRNPYRESRPEPGDMEYDRDWDMDRRPGDRFENYRGRPAPSAQHGGTWHERDERSMYGGSHEGRWGGGEGMPGRRRAYSSDDDDAMRFQRQRDRSRFQGGYPSQTGGSRRHESGQSDYTGRGPSGYRRSDERITEELNDKLTWDWRVDATDITVEVKDGVATLTGHVRDRRMKRRAEDLADEIRGIEDVHNQIRVSRSGQDHGSQGSGQTPRQAGGEGETIADSGMGTHNRGGQNDD